MAGTWNTRPEALQVREIEPKLTSDVLTIRTERETAGDGTHEETAGHSRGDEARVIHSRKRERKSCRESAAEDTVEGGASSRATFVTLCGPASPLRKPQVASVQAEGRAPTDKNGYYVGTVTNPQTGY